jgi:hypothetical protein
MRRSNERWSDARDTVVAIKLEPLLPVKRSILFFNKLLVQAWQYRRCLRQCWCAAIEGRFWTNHLAGLR